MKQTYIYGKNSVVEFLNNGHIPEYVLIRKGIRKDRKINHILKICNNNGIRVEYTTEGNLNRLTKNGNHQGVIIVSDRANKFEFMEFDTLLDELSEEENSCVVLLDSIQDTHNMGAIIRSAEFFGISAVILPVKNSAPINETVFKTSSGAVEYIRISKVNNLKYAIERLKDIGFWIYGTYIDNGEKLNDTSFDKKTALILGSESVGMRKSLINFCDYMIFIDRIGNIDSLNVSVTAGILFYEYSKKNK